MNLTNSKPPQDIQIERAVLCSIINDKYAQTASFGLIKSSKIFFVNANRIIYEKLKDIFDQGLPISTKLLFVELKKSGLVESVGGVQFITDLSYAGVLNEKIEHHILILKELWIRRELIESAVKNYQNAIDETKDVFELLEESQKSLMDISSELNRSKSQSMVEILKNCLSESQSAMANGGLSGISTGWGEWDKKIGGLKENNLIIIAARPAMGKSALALALMKNVMLQQKRCQYFSLEMSNSQLGHRLISSESGVSYSRAIDGRISEEELIKMGNSIGRICNDYIEIVETSAIKMTEIRSSAYSMKALKGLDLIVIDYLQLIDSVQVKGQTRDRELGIITAGLKSLAKELRIPIVLLAQLSREVEKRSDKRPQLSDLRESGSIEQDADIVIFPLRPEYYGITQLENGESTKDLMINIVAKNRGGAVGDIHNYCKIAFNKVEDINYVESYQTEIAPKYENQHDFFKNNTDSNEPGF